MLRVGMIGAGIIGKSHADALKEIDGVSLVAVTDIIYDRAKNFGEVYDVAYYTDYKEMVESEKIDIALINLPHGLHKEVAIYCANNNLNVFLEKPMANNIEECLEIIESAKKNNVKVMIGHIQRYIAENIIAKELVQSGKYGDLVSIVDVRNINYFNNDRPKWFFDKKLAGGGIVMNYGAHSLDKIKWITGLDIENITGKLNQHKKEYNVEGDAQILVNLSNNVSAMISYCGYDTPSFNETMIYLTGGTIKLQTGYKVWVSGVNEFKQIEIEDKKNSFVLMWEDFINSLINNQKPPVDSEYALDIIKNIEELYIENNI